MRRFSLFLALCAAFTVLAADYKPIVLDPSYDHDRWNTQPKDIVRMFRAYTVSFDGTDDNNGDGFGDRWGVPEWVAYEIRGRDTELPAGPKRPSPWISDDPLAAAGIAPTDDTYRNSGFDRGHMCMKQIGWRLGENADWNTHTTLNACPQIHAFNAGIWLDMENLTQEWADRYGVVWVICGPVFTHRAPAKFIGDEGEMRIGVPDAFFKIVIREDADGTLHILALVYPHRDIDRDDNGEYPQAQYLTSIDQVEALTGLDFLTDLPDEAEDAVEAVKATELWE